MVSLLARQSFVILVMSMLCHSMANYWEMDTKNNPSSTTPVSEKFIDQKIKNLQEKFEALLDQKFNSIAVNFLPILSNQINLESKIEAQLKINLKPIAQEIETLNFKIDSALPKNSEETTCKFDQQLSSSIDLLAENSKVTTKIIKDINKNNPLCCTKAQNITTSYPIIVDNSLEVEAYCNKYYSAVFASLFRREKRGICSTYKSQTISAADDNACGKLCVEKGKSCLGFCYSDTTYACNIYSVPSPRGTKVIKGIGYVYPNVQKNYQGAVNYCGNIGLYLALPMNAAEHEAVRSVAGSGTFYWIGVHDKAHEGAFKCEHNGAKPPYFKWHAPQPDNAGGNEDCVHIWERGWWNDNGCAVTTVHNSRLQQIPIKFVCQTTPPCVCHNAPAGKGEAKGQSCYMRKP